MQIGGVALHTASSPAARPTASVAPAEALPSSASTPSTPVDEQTTASPAPSASTSADNPRQQRLEQLEVTELLSRDAEVRAHEQAHASIGGIYAGAPSYTYDRGPDGKRYAVGGEVGIDVSPVPNDPQATLQKMQVVLRAALAPVEPSAQDLRVAGRAQAQIVQARSELAEQQRTAAAEERDKQTTEATQKTEADGATEDPQAADRQVATASPALELYQRLGAPESVTPLIDLRA